MQGITMKGGFEMLFIVFFVSWMGTCALMAGIEWLWKRHKARTQKIIRLERENRRLNTVLDFYENISAGDSLYGRMIVCDKKYTK
jgi:hypothetical protein